MKISISYTLAGDTPRIVTTTPKVMVEWERKFATKASSATLGIEDLCFMAWETVRSSGVVIPPFDIWLGTVEELHVADDTETSNPTRPVPPAA